MASMMEVVEENARQIEQMFDTHFIFGEGFEDWLKELGFDPKAWVLQAKGFRLRVGVAGVGRIAVYLTRGLDEIRLCDVETRGDLFLILKALKVK